MATWVVRPYTPVLPYQFVPSLFFVKCIAPAPGTVFSRFARLCAICTRYIYQTFTTLGPLLTIFQVPYRTYLTKQLSVAYDVYLEILHCVDNQLKKAMGRDTPNWQLLNACPACCYKLKNEPSLDFEWLVSIDGNNSLKRWDPTVYGITPRLDTRRPRSDYWIDPDGVNSFQYEVNSKPVSTYPVIKPCLKHEID